MSFLPSFLCAEALSGTDTKFPVGSLLPVNFGLSGIRLLNWMPHLPSQWKVLLSPSVLSVTKLQIPEASLPSFSRFLLISHRCMCGHQVLVTTCSLIEQNDGTVGRRTALLPQGSHCPSEGHLISSGHCLMGWLQQATTFSFTLPQGMRRDGGEKMFDRVTPLIKSHHRLHCT